MRWSDTTRRDAARLILSTDRVLVVVVVALSLFAAAAAAAADFKHDEQFQFCFESARCKSCPRPNQVSRTVRVTNCVCFVLVLRVERFRLLIAIGKARVCVSSVSVCSCVSVCLCAGSRNFKSAIAET